MYDIKSLIKRNEYTLFIKYTDKFWTEHRFKENNIINIFNDKTGYLDGNIKLDKITWNYRNYIKGNMPKIDIVYSKNNFDNATIIPKFKIYLDENIDKNKNIDIDKNIAIDDIKNKSIDISLNNNIKKWSIKKINNLKYIILILLGIVLVLLPYYLVIEMTNYIDNMDCPTCFGLMWWWILMLVWFFILWIIWILWIIIFTLTISYRFINYITQYGTNIKTLRIISLISFVLLFLILLTNIKWNFTIYFLFEKEFYILLILSLVCLFIFIISFFKILFKKKN